MIRRSLISGFALVNLAVVASAFPLSHCDGFASPDYHFSESGHQIVGDGVVAYKFGGVFCWDGTGCTESESLIFSACQTGQTLKIVTKLNRELDDTLLDRRDEAERTMRQMTDDTASRTWDSVKRVFVSKAFRVDETTETAENCACAAAFPELRNGKDKFEGL